MTKPISIGHPALVAAIAEEIEASGPMTFARFMDLALYHEPYGYYMRETDGEDRIGPGRACEDRIGQGRVCEDRIGWNGDFYTSSDVHPVLAQALARQAAQIDELLDRPDRFTVLEMGAGKGFLARDFLTACQGLPGGFFDRLHYVIVERSPAMKASQRRELAPWLGTDSRVTWLDSLDQMPAGSLVGLALSNELVDAFPVHRVVVEEGRPKELFVGWNDGRFVERTGPLSTPDLSRYLQRLAGADVVLSEGYRTEINLAALAWMKDVARVMGRGFVLTIDYGHTAQDLYGTDRRKGTLLCYFHQMASEDPYTRVGMQDMTAHVDFTSLATIGEESGLRVTGFTNQMSFLMGLGVEQILDGLEPGSREFQAIVHLLRPEGMGRTFKMLFQHKGVGVGGARVPVAASIATGDGPPSATDEPPALEGLRFKPFFGSALALPVDVKG